MWSYLSFSVNRMLRLSGSRGNGNGESALTSKALSVPSLRQAMPDLRLELSRARRYERPLSVLLFTALEEAHNGPAPERQEGSLPSELAILLKREMPQLTSLLVGALLRDLIRQTDHLAYATTEDQLVIALPETDRDRAHQLLRRIGPEMRARVNMTFEAGVAVFPGDGFTLRDLMEQANHRSTPPSSALQGGANGGARPGRENRQ